MKKFNFREADSAMQQLALELYRSSFPAYERRSEAAHRKALNDPLYDALLFVNDQNQLLALFFYWNNDNMIYIEHIAVNPNLRGQNIGSTVLKEFIALNSGKTLILEIDPLIDEVAIRRLRFYAHLGFIENEYDYVHPSYTTNGTPHKLIIMSYLQKINQAEFERFIKYMKDTVMQYID